jgi:hypothetical protein
LAHDPNLAVVQLSIRNLSIVEKHKLFYMKKYLNAVPQNIF